MLNINSPINEILFGDKAFYKNDDYKTELGLNHPLKEISYRHTSTPKFWRVSYDIISVILFPIGVCRIIHHLAGKILLPASNKIAMKQAKFTDEYLDGLRKKADSKEWKCKRITVEVNGNKVDALIMGKAENLGNGRWMLGSCGNAMMYEQFLNKSHLTEIAEGLNSNLLLFNYQGVGRSEGSASYSSMKNTYETMLQVLEDKDNGIGAKEVIGYGLSIGGGVQGAALEDHKLKHDIKYVFIKDRTFSDLSAAASTLVARIAGLAVRLFGWNLSSKKSSRQLQCPEVIIQRSPKHVMEKPEDVKFDGVIYSDASLAKDLLSDPTCPKNNKEFVGIWETHNAGMLPQTVERVVQAVEKHL